MPSFGRRPLLTPPRHVYARRVARTSVCLLIAGLGCWGCTRPAVVPPLVSIPRPQPVWPAEPVVPVTPLAPEFDPEPHTLPLNPIGSNPWRPTIDPRNWKYLVLHHTASDAGNVESIHNTHLKNKDKNGKHWLGIGYHFVIGNGQGMDDGEIEPTFRWKQQMPGAHAGVNEHNQRGIGIVLIGNFEKSQPTPRQVKSVKELVAVLAREYAIHAEHVIGHGDIKATECPGQFFPLSNVRASVAAVSGHDGQSLARVAEGKLER
ncbi:MAG TPA: peptidoglycan recognition family protein [Planctomycetaceae bacterium]|nr:peptidoglycan recognition family protein [Planctomycetaceae bacterium]